MKKDTRNSKDRVATYAQKMKTLGYKQIGFFLSPAAHESIIKLTAVDKRVNASLAATTNTLFESLSEKYFVYQAITNKANPYEMMEAIDKTIKFLQKIRKQNEEEIAEENARFNAMVESGEISKETIEADAKFEAEVNDFEYQELVKSGKIKPNTN